MHGHALVGGGAGESLEAYAGILLLGGGGRRWGRPSGAPRGNRPDGAGVDWLGRGRRYTPLQEG